MKNKGFTLIELLAVIVIPAIIALIAVPIILNIIDSSKNSANERSKELYLDAVEQAIERKNLTDKNGYNPTECTVNGTGNLDCKNEEGDLSELIVEINGTKPNEGGIITFENGKITSEALEFRNGTDGGSTAPDLTTTPISCFNYVEVDGTMTITGYNTTNEECSLDVVIPSKIDGKDVTVIGEESFYGKGLTGIVIPNGITLIGSYAFFENELTSVTIPNSVTNIESWAFVNNPLTSLVIKAPRSKITIDSTIYEGNIPGFSEDNIIWES